MASSGEDPAVDAFCVEWCKRKVKVLDVDVDASWRPKVRRRARRAELRARSPASPLSLARKSR